MAITAIKEKVSGSDKAFAVPYYVGDPADDMATITWDQAFAAAAAQFGIDYPTDGYRAFAHEQLSDSAYRITFTVSGEGQSGGTPAPPSPSYPAIDEERITYRYNLASRFLYKTPFALVDSQPAGAPDNGGSLNVAHDGLRDVVKGATITAPPPNIILNRTMDEQAWGLLRPAILPMGGTVNSDQIMIDGESYEPGEMLLVSITGGLAGTQGEVTQYQVALGISHVPTRTSETYGGITIPSVRGHDYVWTYDFTTPFGIEPQYAYVQQVHEYTTWAGVIGGTPP